MRDHRDGTAGDVRRSLAGPTRFIATSGDDLPAAALTALAADGYLRKPFSLTELRAVVGPALAR